MQEYKRLKPFQKGLFNDRKLLRSEQRKASATENGYTLLDELDGDNGRYWHNQCGTVLSKQFGNMRSGNVKCRNCMLEKFKGESLLQGYTFLEQVELGDEALYKCNRCNQESIFQISHVRAGNAKCKHCMIEAWKSEATSKGFTWLGQVSKDRSLYKHAFCGRELEICMGSVPDKCRFCQEDRYKDDASRQGYEWIRRDRRVKSLYRHIKCGNTQTKALNDMRVGKVCCAFCGDNWYTKKSTIYLLKITLDDFSWLKLGIAQNVSKRIKTYGLKNACKIEVLFAKEFQSGKESVTIENYLHLKHSSRNLNSADMKFFMKNGFTECYSQCAEKDLLKDLSVLGKENE